MEKQPFYLSKRKLNSGHSVYYFYYYDQFGNRTVPKSTGLSRKSEAFNYCVTLLKSNNLGNNKTKFSVYAQNFFAINSRWYRDKLLTKEVSQHTYEGYVSAFKYHIFPYFSEMYIDKITSNVVREFRIYLSDVKSLSNKTINNIVDVTRIIFDWAVEDNYILRTPITKFIKPLPKEKSRDAYTLEELIWLLRKPWNNYQAWLFTLTVAITGLRFGECLGLQRSKIHKNYLDITQQFNYGEIRPTKTKENRFVPIPEELAELLIKNGAGCDFIFNSPEDFTKPISRSTIVRNLYSNYSPAMQEEKSGRLLTTHSGRYFFNTYLVKNEIQSQKIDFILGHSTGKGSMQSLYTSWKPEMYEDVLKLQKDLLIQILGEKPEVFLTHN